MRAPGRPHCLTDPPGLSVLSRVAEPAKSARLSPLAWPRPPRARIHPSAKLAEFVRRRDRTCRARGCDRPAEFCDLDSTPYHAGGATHPSNLKCLCRKHRVHKRVLRQAK
jgi:hypothetical protein